MNQSEPARRAGAAAKHARTTHRRLARRLCVPLSIGAGLVGWWAGGAWATTYFSNETSYVVGSTTFVDQASISDCLTYGDVHIRHQNNSTMAAGHVGVRWQMYWSSGAQIFAQPWQYSQQSLTLFQYAARVRGYEGWAYVDGRSAAYNGSGYTSHGTGRTPNAMICGS